jgi:predicted  nucleic acid-binding Zn-ribbon protein
MKTFVAFDTGHKERGKLNENYTQLKEFLEANNFACHEYFETSITQESLEGYDILVFACPDFAKISNNEMIEIENWVKQDGGGLLLLSHAGGDKGRGSNLSEISEIFGITFENDQVLDKQQNIGLENLPIITNFTPPHPITSGISKICYRAGCSLSVIGAAIPVAISNESSDPFSSPLICVSEPEKGRVFCSGSYEMFRDKIGGGLQYETHTDLALNIFSWLVSEYRTDMKALGEYEEPETQDSEFGTSEMDLGSTLMDKALGDVPAIQLKTEIKIADQSDLMKLLHEYLAQINHMKNTIETLIERVSISEDDIVELRKQKEEHIAETESKEEEEISEDMAQPMFSDEDFESLKKEKKPTTRTNETKKPKDKTGLKEELTEGLEEEVEIEEEEEVIDIENRREELEAEVGSLEKKLKSVLNLLEFIEKNYISGKMDEDTYNKQKKKLNREIQKIRKRIGKITSALEKN